MRWVRHIAFGFACLLWLSRVGFAQDIRVNVLSDSVFVGERFDVAVVVTQSSDGTVVFPDVPVGSAEIGPLASFGDVELFDARRLPPRISNATRTDSIVYRAATFELDEAMIGGMPITLIAGTDTTVVVSPTATVTVRSVLPTGEVNLLPPLGPASFSSPLWLWIVVILAVVLIIACAVLFWMRSRKRTRGRRPLLAPFPEATTRLDALSTPQTEPEIKPYYVELSDLLRTYLGRTLGVAALEQTTRELVHELQSEEHVSADALKRIDGALRVSDLVKFADVHPDDESHELVVVKTREAVEMIEAAVHPPETDVEDAV